MDNSELQKIWQSYDQKMNDVLAVNKALAIDLTRQKLNRQIRRLNRPKWFAVIVGLPYTIIVMGVTIMATLAQAYLIAIGFGAIALITAALLGSYFYQLYLIDQVSNSEDVLSTQEQLSQLKLSSFRSLNLAVFQLPFWSVCWVSIDALRDSPLLYGGVNLVVFLLLAYLSFWIYQKLSDRSKPSKVRDFFRSGREWEPMVKAEALLEQIKEYDRPHE